VNRFFPLQYFARIDKEARFASFALAFVDSHHPRRLCGLMFKVASPFILFLYTVAPRPSPRWWILKVDNRKFQ